MDTKDDKKSSGAAKQQQEAMWFTYPEVKTIRANPIPRQDSSWINELNERVFETLGYEEVAGRKATRATQPHLHMSLCSKPLKLAQDDRFPAFDVFNAARARFQKHGADVLANLDPLDKKLLGNFEGYELMDTDGKWYLTHCLKVGLKESERIGKTIFTTRKRYGNSLPHLLRALENVRKRVATEPKDLFKEFMRIILRISMHAHCIINGRVLRQKPAAGVKYEESEPPYLFGIFPQRDMYCRPEFEKKVLQGLDFASLDMVEFAKRSTVAEFTWVVAEWLSRQPGSVVDSKKAVEFFAKDLHEHWRAHFWKMRIRVADTAEAMVKPLNGLLPEAAVKDIDKAKIKIEKKSEASGKSGTTTKFSVDDRHRMWHGKTKTAIYQVWTFAAAAAAAATRSQKSSQQAESNQLHSVNWIAWLGTTVLFTYPELDPYRAPFDTSTAALSDLGWYEKPHEFEDAVCHWAYLFCAGAPVSAKAKDDDLQRDAAPFINTLRHYYSIYLNDSNRLCHSGPLPHEFRNVATATTSALNIQMPAWMWLWTAARVNVKAPISQDYVRAGVDQQPLYADLHQQQQQLLPLYWLLQLDRLTGFSRTGPSPFDVSQPPEGKLVDARANDEQQEPMPGVVEKRVLAQARFLESTPQHASVIKKLQSIGTCLDIYRDFLKSRLQANEEIHALHLFQQQCRLVKELDLSSETVQCQILQLVQWGERLWRAQAYLAGVRLINPRTSPAATYTRSALFPHYAAIVRSGASTEGLFHKALIRHDSQQSQQPALCTLKSFWEEILGSVLDIRKPLGAKDRAAYDDFLAALLEQRPPETPNAEMAFQQAPWLLECRDSVVTPAFVRGEKKKKTAAAGVLHAAIVAGVLRRLILPLSVYASLRFPSFGPLLYQGGLTRSQLLLQPDKAAEAHSRVVEVAKLARQQHKSAAAVPAVLHDRSIPVLQRLAEAWKHLVAVVRPELNAKTNVDGASIPLVEALCEQLPRDNAFVQEVGSQLVTGRRYNQLKQKLEYFLSSSGRDKRPGGGRYLTFQALHSLLGDCDWLLGGPDDVAERLVQLLDEELATEFTTLEATVKALQGSEEKVITPLLRKAYEKRREARLQPIPNPGGGEGGLFIVPSAAAAAAAPDPTKRKPTQPTQELDAAAQLAGMFS